METEMPRFPKQQIPQDFPNKRSMRGKVRGWSVGGWERGGCGCVVTRTWLVKGGTMELQIIVCTTNGNQEFHLERDAQIHMPS